MSHPWRTRFAPWSATAAGLGALLLWSATVGVARRLTEELGPLTAAAASFTVAGLAALLGLALGWPRFQRLRVLPRSYLAVGGALFACYMLLLFLGLGLADNRAQALEVGLLNYLWPALTLLLTVSFLGHRAHFSLLPGTLLALAGVAVVLTQDSTFSARSFAANWMRNPAAYSMGAGAGLAWALYSVLTRKLAGGRPTGGVVLFLPVTALLLWAVRAFSGEPWSMTPRTAAELLFLGFSTWLGYAWWDKGLRHGRIVILGAAAYLTPLLATLWGAFYLNIATTPRLWSGCALLIAGSALSLIGVEETPRSPPDQPA